MEASTLVLVVYFGLLGGSVLVLLFGELECARGTLLERLHGFLTRGLCDGAYWLAGRAFGARATGVLDAVAECYCERPNPAMQLVYVGIVCGGYAVFVRFGVLDLIPNGAVGEVHRYTAPLAVLVGLALFLATSFSDPGAVTAQNVEAHLAAFPYDGVLYAPKTCPTLRIPCPARSKFCRVTNRRVARFDHFCVWMNNTIGENNTRYFVGFLCWHVVLCTYGFVLMCAIVYGEVAASGVMDATFESPRDRTRFEVRTSPKVLMHWVAFHYQGCVILAALLAVTGVLLAAFAAYHLALIWRNVTTSETFKYKDARERLAAQRLADGEEPAEGGAEPGCFRRALALVGLAPRGEGRAPLPEVANVYDHGPLQNLVEVLWPRSQRAGPRKAKRA